MLRSDNWHKYSAVPTTVDGIRFDSKREAARYQDLKLLFQAGKIHDLKTQVPFDLKVNGVKVCRYVADFTYLEGGKKIVEDCKGVRTAVYNLKRKLMLAVLDIAIRET